MKASQSKNMACNICGKTKARSRMMPAALVRNAVAEQIKTSYPDWKPEGYICLSDLNRFRMQYIQNLLESEKGELTTLDHEVLESLQRHETLSSNVDAEFEKDSTLGEKMADGLASFGGSWTFLIIFASILLIWIALNSFLLLKKTIRSLSVYSAQPGFILSGGHSGPRYHDEPEPPGSQRPSAVAARLSRELKSRT